MIKERLQKYLIYKKVFVKNKSEKLQKKLFEIGFRWNVQPEISGEIQYLDAPFLYLDKDLKINMDYQVDKFYRSNKEEIQVEDILEFEIDEEQVFRPFDQVLWRFDENSVWKAGLYSHAKDDKYYIVGFGYIFKDCVIPYRGNEERIGKVTI